MLDIRAHDTTAAAPGDLELLQRFLNLHDHVEGLDADAPPPPRMVREFLVGRGLLAEEASYSDDDHAKALALSRALHGRLRRRAAGESSARDDRELETAADRAFLRVRFADRPGLEPAADGIDGALGSLLSVLFLAELDGTWAQMKECASESCTAVFYDRSRNRSGRWCSMRSCGNRHKVRAWRERRRADAVDA
jgi:predicted RNA-binding Zn ribbon-like protein